MTAQERAKEVWTKFRAWPTWAQVTSWIFVAFLFIGLFGGEDEEPEERVLLADATTSTTAVEDALPFASTTTTAEATTTTAAPTTTASPTTTDPPRTTQAPTTARPTTTAARSTSSCDPNYSGACVPAFPPDVNCGDLSAKDFSSIGSDPHGLDGDNDGVACES